MKNAFPMEGIFLCPFLPIIFYIYSINLYVMEIVKEYSNSDVTIVWKPGMCIHSAICAKGLPHVFQPREKPWIKQYAATSDILMAQVLKCPSGALSFYKNNEKSQNNG